MRDLLHLLILSHAAWRRGSPIDKLRVRTAAVVRHAPMGAAHHEENVGPRASRLAFHARQEPRDPGGRPIMRLRRHVMMSLTF